MTSLTIPPRWLIPQKRSREWIFQCGVSLPDLVKTNRAARYFRQLVTLLEDDNQILNYHLKLRHNSKRYNQLDVLIYFGDPNRTSNPIITPICISCEPTNELSLASLLSAQQYTRAWLDGRARAKFILTPIRHIERLSDLTDEDGEMEAFWHDAVQLIDEEVDQLENYYPTMVLNHGTYRNHAHLHLKINFAQGFWNRTIAPRHQEKLNRIENLLQDSAFVTDCLGQHCFEKKPHQRKPTKNSDTSNQDAKSNA
jgi:diadenosine tetraphosphate (Ap4A) HIT family hydrolase